MLALTQPQLDALAHWRVVRRIFIWCEARDPNTGLPDPAGFWDDVGTVAHEGRTYYGYGNVARVSTLTATAEMSIPGLEIVLNDVSPEVVSLVRGSTVGQAPITMSIGLFDPDTRLLIGPLIRRFVGFVDAIEVKTPDAGGESTVTLTCESTSRALTIKQTGTRSPSTQSQRDVNDRFFDYAGGQREQTVYFGRMGP